MVKILKKILIKKIQFLSIFISPNPKKVTFIRKYYSGSNVTPVYEKMKNNEKGIEVELFHNHPDDMNIFNQTKLYLKLLKSKVIVTTHGVSLKTKKNITFDLWHGKSLKALNLLDPLDKESQPIKNIDFLNSYSTTTTTLLNACFGMKAENYVTLGSPRNDALFEKENEEKKRKILEAGEDEKLIFSMPTYRKYIKENYEDFVKNFAMGDFNLEVFNSFLKENNYRIILKPHPHDNETWKKVFNTSELSNISLISEETLEENDIELNQLLAVSDLLITDYSSVFLDYLLTDNPMIFIPTDLEKYKDAISLIVQPYDFWAPGPKCFNQEELQKEIKKSIEDKSYYKEERDTVKKILHKYMDNKSTERVIEFLEELVYKVGSKP